MAKIQIRIFLTIILARQELTSNIIRVLEKGLQSLWKIDAMSASTSCENDHQAKMKTIDRHFIYIYFVFVSISLLKSISLKGYWIYAVKKDFFCLVYVGRKQKKTTETLNNSNIEHVWIQVGSARIVKLFEKFDLYAILFIFLFSDEHFHCCAFRWHQCSIDHLGEHLILAPEKAEREEAQRTDGTFPREAVHTPESILRYVRKSDYKGKHRILIISIRMKAIFLFRCRILYIKYTQCVCGELQLKPVWIGFNCSYQSLSVSKYELH